MLGYLTIPSAILGARHRLIFVVGRRSNLTAWLRKKEARWREVKVRPLNEVDLRRGFSLFVS